MRDGIAGKTEQLTVVQQHEGREVKLGEKWVLRTDLCVQR